MTLSHFEKQVILLAGESMYNTYRPDLLALTATCQERVIYALEKDLPLPDAIWHTILSKKLPDLHFERYMRYVVNNL